jgi:hypothetical protein
MSITCRICNKELKKQITNTHLKTHAISTNQYKNTYGADSLTCSEYRKNLSEKRQGKNNPNFNNSWSVEKCEAMSKIKKGSIPWNKDKTCIATEKHILGIKERERKYTSGEIIRKSIILTEASKQQIGVSVKKYAESHPDEMKERSMKAVQTKINNNYDFGSPMRGKKHTPESLIRIEVGLRESNIKKSEQSIIKLTENAVKANCKVLAFEDDRMLLQCNDCNTEFSYTKQYFNACKLVINRCPVCYPSVQPKRSTGENELYEFVHSLDNTAQSNVRHVLGRSEIDIYLPNQKIAIEYNGLYWHSEKVLESVGKSKNADFEKRNKLQELGIRYIAVFEDEWINKKEIVQSRICNLLQHSSNVIYARKCNIREVDSNEASAFCNRHHVQGKGRSNARYGLYHNDELVSLMTFSKSNLSRRITEWEINRFCSKINTTVVGAASRLFKHFLTIHDPSTVVSYADSRWSEGALYKTLGFDFSHETSPNYWYSLPNSLTRIHRYALRKTSKDDQLLTEKQMRDSQGYLRIWDCGSTKWIWRKSE